MIPVNPKSIVASKPLFYRIFRTRLGWCAVVGNGEGIRHVVLPMSSRVAVERLLRKSWPQPLQKDRDALACAESQIRDYFAGRRRHFDLPIIPEGRGAFERAVYAATRRIPFGKTATYAWIAQKVGKPGAARAVGRAMARNPVPLLVPCHRILGSDGSLCGFTSEGGLELKQTLLDLEKGLRTPR